MSSIFEKLQKIAMEQFGCTLVKGTQRDSFEKLFGFSVEDIAQSNNVIEAPVSTDTVYQTVFTSLVCKEIGVFELDTVANDYVVLAA